MVILACAMHNICEAKGETFLEAWAEKAQCHRGQCVALVGEPLGHNNPQGVLARDTLAKH